MSGDGFVTAMWLPQASGGNRPGTLLSILQCTGQAPQPRNVWPKVSPVLRKAASVELTNTGPKAGGARWGVGSREAPNCPGYYQRD